MNTRVSPRKNILRTATYEINSMEGGVEMLGTEILNVSAGGACIKTSREIKPGRVISLRLEVKDAGIEVPCIAEVRWAKPCNNEYTIGLQFLS